MEQAKKTGSGMYAFDFCSYGIPDGTRMVEQGLDMKVVQYIMGHANIRVTMEAYNHITDPERARIKNEIAKIDAVQVVQEIHHAPHEQVRSVTAVAA